MYTVRLALPLLLPLVLAIVTIRITSPPKRPNHRDRLTNEMLARPLAIFASYFLALLLKPDWNAYMLFDGLRSFDVLFIGAAVMALWFFFNSNKCIAEQNAIVEKRGRTSNDPLPGHLFKTVLWNALIMVFVAVVVICLAGHFGAPCIPISNRT